MRVRVRVETYWGSRKRASVVGASGDKAKRAGVGRGRTQVVAAWCGQVGADQGGDWDGGGCGQGKVGTEAVKNSQIGWRGTEGHRYMVILQV